MIVAAIATACAVPSEKEFPATAVPANIEPAVAQDDERLAVSDAVAGGFDLHQEYAVSVAGRGLERSDGGTVTRTSRLRLRDRAGTRERWVYRSHAFVRAADGTWHLHRTDDRVLYDGRPLSDSLHSRYGGTFMIEPGKVVRLAWLGGVLMATMPDGSTRQVFLVSSSEENEDAANGGHFRFTLAEDGKPATVAWVHGGHEAWRATRSPPE